MNFFRLRVLNTLLLFIVGVVLGFMIKDKFYPAQAPSAPAAYQSSSPQFPAAATEAAGEDISEDGADTPQDDSEMPAEEPYVQSQPQRQPEPAYKAPAWEPPAARAEPIVIEPAAKPRPAVTGMERDFFRSPGRYEGRELELELQMITARKTHDGWRLNLVYTGPDKKIDYLYVDDSSVLGEKPDLRIGYAYKLRFLCGAGDPASGNTLISISPAGGKAEWATGLSAIE